MYTFKCVCTSMLDSTVLTKEKFFCILENYKLYCTARSLPAYTKEIERLKIVHGKEFFIKFVDSHAKSEFKSSDTVCLCLYSTCAETEVSRILDESCCAEFIKFAANHFCLLREPCRIISFEPKAFFDKVAPKQYF